MRCMERSFRTKFYFHLAMKRKRQKERKEGRKMLRCSISNFISWHMSLSHRHTKWDRLNSEMGSRARCAEKKKTKILENIFTAIKYSGLEDSNKFPTDVCTLCVYLWINKTISEGCQQLGRRKIDNKYKLELMHDDKNIQPRINLYFAILLLLLSFLCALPENV